jgi:alkylated DNA repair dioxygenase AlkB
VSNSTKQGNEKFFVPSFKMEERVLARIQAYNAATGTYSPKEWIDFITIDENNSHQFSFTIHLKRGGRITIYPNLLSEEQCAEIKKELLESSLFRQYRIQGNDEPRMHFLLHEDATMDDTQAQPGYHYASLNMKAKPLNLLPKLEELSGYIADVCGVDKWTIGVDPVIYRDGRDKMGNHADDDQGEKIICALLVAGAKARKVKIRTFTHLEPMEGDEQIELFLGPRDAYVMDGRMQESYSHCVPPDPTQENQDHAERIAIVFRTGDERIFLKDSGRVCTDLSPRVKKKYNFGHGKMQEGTMYTRRQLYDMEAHLGQQRGISGNQKVGCDAIIVSGKWPGCDKFKTLLYTANSKVGARAIVRSHHQKFPIRVFRSDTYESPFRAAGKRASSSKLYRYDGLYHVMMHEEPQESEGEFQFVLERLDDGMNLVSNQDILQQCETLGTIHDKANRDFLAWVDLHTSEEERELLYNQLTKPVRGLSYMKGLKLFEIIQTFQASGKSYRWSTMAKLKTASPVSLETCRIVSDYMSQAFGASSTIVGSNSTDSWSPTDYTRFLDSRDSSCFHSNQNDRSGPRIEATKMLGTVAYDFDVLPTDHVDELQFQAALDLLFARKNEALASSLMFDQRRKQANSIRATKKKRNLSNNGMDKGSQMNPSSKRPRVMETFDREPNSCLPQPLVPQMTCFPSSALGLSLPSLSEVSDPMRSLEEFVAMRLCALSIP